jgi:hypothetical protein
MSFVPCQFGRSKASTSSKMSNSCNQRRILFRSRCQIELTCKSSIDLCQRNVLGTSTGCRLSFKKYSSTIAGGTAARIVHCHQDNIGRKFGIGLGLGSWGDIGTDAVRSTNELFSYGISRQYCPIACNIPNGIGQLFRQLKHPEILKICLRHNNPLITKAIIGPTRASPSSRLRGLRRGRCFGRVGRTCRVWCKILWPIRRKRRGFVCIFSRGVGLW